MTKNDISPAVSLTEIAALSRQLSTWLTDNALPFWREHGFDGPGGGFAETVGFDGEATRDDRRGRVQPRQVYCFAKAGLHGWNGDWRTPAEAGIAYFDRVFLQESGFYATLADADGTLLDPAFDVYIQAFALLGYASLGKAVPERNAEMAARSDAFRTRLEAWCKHPAGGFEEDNPPRLPLRANPHMHLFEACLASEAVAGFDSQAWGALADEIAGLCMARFIDPQTGVLREFFDADWGRFPGVKGRMVEPGHLFEWAWLLLIWAERRRHDGAVAHAKRLFEIAETHGVCARRHVATMGLLDDFTLVDPIARMWSQTEWLKSAIRLAAQSDGPERARYLASAGRAGAALRRFLDVPVAGLWFDKMREDGSFVEEPAPASTFYHIVCAIYEVEDCLARIR